MSASLGIVLPKDGESALFGNIGSYARLLDSLSISIEIMFPSAEGPAGTIDGTEVAPLAIHQQRLPGSHIIDEPAPTHNATQFGIGQTLINHGEIVAEIEIVLHGILLLQRSAVTMIDIDPQQAQTISSAPPFARPRVDY